MIPGREYTRRPKSLQPGVQVWRPYLHSAHLARTCPAVSARMSTTTAAERRPVRTTVYCNRLNLISCIYESPTPYYQICRISIHSTCRISIHKHCVTDLRACARIYALHGTRPYTPRRWWTCAPARRPDLSTRSLLAGPQPELKACCFLIL
jgi:hypothetical protein